MKRLSCLVTFLALFPFSMAHGSDLESLPSQNLPGCLFLFRTMSDGFNPRDKQTAHRKQAVDFPLQKVADRIENVEGAAAKGILAGDSPGAIGTKADVIRRTMDIFSRFHNLLRRSGKYQELRDALHEFESAGDHEMS